MSEQPSSSAPLVPGYAGHADAAARWMSDHEVRAWVGEILIGLPERLPADDGLRRKVDALLVRCEFGDQHVIRALEDERFGRPDLTAALDAYDRALVEAAADRCRTASPDELVAAIAALERAFEERDQGIVAAAR